jgi:hypothetical protein
MACEVLCCEVPAMVDMVVEARDGLLLERLFGLIASPNPVPYRLAGYFEKVRILDAPLRRHGRQRTIR